MNILLEKGADQYYNVFMDDVKIVREFKRNVQKFYPYAEVYFYGSRVKKTHREDSDYDVLVLLNEIDPAVRKKIYDIAWEIGFKNETVVAPVLSRKDEFYPSSHSPFLENVRKHGIVI